ncbi:MAG TPA: hypothetical protein PLE77_01980 [Kiritimatiellia bacterium]|nr:hypothetical protein [Kiritimatiellia bacterium]
MVSLRRGAFCLLLAAGCLLGTPAAQAAKADDGIKRMSDKQIKAMEVEADKARALFFAGRYAEAAAAFQPLVKDIHASRPLYLCEMGSCYLANGDYAEAKECFLTAADYMETFFDPKLEKRAASLFGAESVKIYKGDPYEKAMNGLLLGLLFLRDNDVDNALACFKNGILSDSDVANEMYKSDFTLLQAVEARCYLLRDEREMYDQSIAQARQSYQMTHPAARDIVVRQQNLMSEAQAQKTRAVKTRNAKTATPSADSQKQFEDLEKELGAVSSNIAMDHVESLMNGDYNTLILFWCGRSPTKGRIGRYGEKSYMMINKGRETRYEVSIDGSAPMDANQGVADVVFQATTRGGRQMDNVLASQADFKAFTSDFGDSLIDSADDVGGIPGLAILLVGAISKGVSAAANAEADIRNWQCLPGSLQVVPAKLAPGKHELAADAYFGYLRSGQRKKTFTIDPAVPINLVFVMPADTVAPPQQP